MDTEQRGREPVFRGTRVPVQTLLDHLKDGYGLLTFLGRFRGLMQEQTDAVLELSAGGIANELRAT